MNDNIEPYLTDLFKGLEVRKNLHKAILFFLTCALRTQPLVPTKGGQKTEIASSGNGIVALTLLIFE